MSALPKHRLSEEEYLAIENVAEFKSEYIDGEMYAMAGAGEEHGTIIANVVTKLNNQFWDRPCKVYSTEMRVRVAETGLYTYPDVIALCGKPDVIRDKGHTLLNPQLIVEVLSPGTAYFDRTEKFRRYQHIPSFNEYVLISQDAFHVEHRQRQPGASGVWETFRYFQLGDRLYFPSLEATLELSDIYHKVDFSPGPLQPDR